MGNAAKQMRIGIYNPYLPTMSGGEKYILSIALCLSEKHSISIFWDPNDESSIKEKAKERFGFNLEKISFTENIFANNISFSRRYLLSRKFDRIIYLSDGSLPLVSPKLVVHFQTPVEWVKYTAKTKLKVKKVSSIICNSKFTKHFIDKKFHVKSKVIYPPVSLQPEGTKKENLILNVGRFGINSQGSSFKKQDVLIDTFKNMVDEGLKDWELVLVMSVRDSDEEELKKLEKHCDGYPIRIIKNPKNNVLWEYYKKAKIYWHAAGYGEDLIQHPDRAEHFGISTVEAMGVGAVPVVISAGGQKEIVEHGKNGYLWETLPDLRKLTLDLMQDEKTWEELSKEGKKRAEEFSLDRFCEQVSEVIA